MRDAIASKPCRGGVAEPDCFAELVIGAAIPQRCKDSSSIELASAVRRGNGRGSLFDSNQGGSCAGAYGALGSDGIRPGRNNNTEPGGLDRTFSGGSGRAASIFCAHEIPAMPMQRREPIRADAARTRGLRHAGCDAGSGYDARACTHKSATSALPSKRTSPADHGMSVLCQSRPNFATH